MPPRRGRRGSRSAVVVGGVVVTVVLDVETGKIGAGATGAEEMVTTRLCGVVPTAFVP